MGIAVCLLFCQTGNRLSHQSGHIIIVVNRKIGRKACNFSMQTQKPCAKRMEGTDLSRLSTGFQKDCPFLHFPRSFFCKGYRQNGTGVYISFANQIGNFCRNHPGLTAACTRQNQKGTALMHNCLILFGIQDRKIFLSPRGKLSRLIFWSIRFIHCSKNIVFQHEGILAEIERKNQYTGISRRAVL